MPWRCKTVKTLLRNAILFDGVSLFGKETDVSIDGGLIEAIGDVDLKKGFDVIHDLSGKILCPGFIDLHCHLRDPGQEWREDLFSGSAAERLEVSRPLSACPIRILLWTVLHW